MTNGLCTTAEIGGGFAENSPMGIKGSSIEISLVTFSIDSQVGILVITPVSVACVLERDLEEWGYPHHHHLAAR